MVRQVPDIAPGNEEAHLDLARLYEERHDRANAVKMYQALSVRPDHAEALYLASLHESQGDLRQARDHLSSFDAGESQTCRCLVFARRFAERGNDLNAAAAALKEAIAVKADLVDAHYNLAFVIGSQGVLAEAEREFLEVLRYRPEYAEAHLNLGMVYTSLNRLEEAEREYERAVALKPNSAEAHYNLGVFYELHRKDMGRALAQYRRYRDLGGRDERSSGSSVWEGPSRPRPNGPSEVKSCVDAPATSLLACRQVSVFVICEVPAQRHCGLSPRRHCPLAVTTGSAVAHELQHAAHHDAGMHGSGICAWMCDRRG